MGDHSNCRPVSLTIKVNPFALHETLIQFRPSKNPILLVPGPSSGAFAILGIPFALLTIDVQMDSEIRTQESSINGEQGSKGNSANWRQRQQGWSSFYATRGTSPPPSLCLLQAS
mmetsp:Transcript_166/g.287  ORF Transcript_166/g.287 Transcript_166/m.287 type:complete len:115 (-) Transcript_166:325-669(-)